MIQLAREAKIPKEELDAIQGTGYEGRLSKKDIKDYIETVSYTHLDVYKRQVLDAQRGYFDAQIGLSNAIRDELIAVVQLYRALGGGWEQNP